MSERPGDSISEFELIDLLRARIAAAGADVSPRLVIGSGDDAAITRPGGATATSVDAMVDGVHFTRADFPPEAIGHKALAAALSDLAACGAEPGEAYVQLGVPTGMTRAELSAIADGMAICAAGAGTVIAGGDVVAAQALFLAITVVGHADSPDRLITRAGARPGDSLVLTGSIGGAAAGLELIRGGGSVDIRPAEVADGLRIRQLRPTPRLAEGRILALAGATAMIDVSDGLAADAGHLARAGGVGLKLDGAAVPLQEGVSALAGEIGMDPLNFALSGGEDYELLASIPAASVEAARDEVARVGGALTVIGRVTEPAAEPVVISGAEDLAGAGGFDQLRDR